MSEHTPGPWAPANVCRATSSGKHTRVTIAQMAGTQPKAVIARDVRYPHDARLIASAPEMAGTISALKAENKRLREALVTLAIPHEALLADSESRKWIAPTIWHDIEDGVRAARAVVAQEVEESDE